MSSTTNNTQPFPPPALSSLAPSSPRSPCRKRRPGVYHARAIGPAQAVPIIPTQYQPIAPAAFAVVPTTNLYALQSTLDRKQVLSKSTTLIIDTGASIGVSPCSADFITLIKPIQQTTLQGIASGLTIKGIGTAQYIVPDDTGTPIVVTIPGTLYVPECPSRLLCPRQLLAHTGNPSAHLTVRASDIIMGFRGRMFTIPYHPTSRLPLLCTTDNLTCLLSTIPPTQIQHPTKLSSGTGTDSFSSNQGNACIKTRI
jgi:hypothetical protein